MRDLLAEGMALFNGGQWFDAHEVFEDLWRAAEGPRRELYRGLAQVCAGLVKHERGQPVPAARLVRRGLASMEGCPHAWRDGLDLDALGAQLRRLAGDLEAGRPIVPPLLRAAAEL